MNKDIYERLKTMLLKSLIRAGCDYHIISVKVYRPISPIKLGAWSPPGTIQLNLKAEVILFPPFNASQIAEGKIGAATIADSNWDHRAPNQIEATLLVSHQFDRPQ